jgi:hypothetical protein
VQDYITDQDIARKLCGDLVNLTSQFPEGGNLYSICIPKEKFNESCYFSKDYGIPMENQELLRPKIDKMQSGEETGEYPQVRILAHKIRAEDGYLVVCNSSLTDDQLQEIDTKISLCLQAALTGRPEKINIAELSSYIKKTEKPRFKDKIS